jgi:hypothetical protein
LRVSADQFFDLTHRFQNPAKLPLKFFLPARTGKVDNLAAIEHVKLVVREPTLKQPTNVLFHESDRDSPIGQHRCKVVTKHVVVLYPTASALLAAKQLGSNR